MIVLTGASAGIGAALAMRPIRGGMPEAVIRLAGHPIHCDLERLG